MRSKDKRRLISSNVFTIISVFTVLQIADQLILRVTALHEKSIIHRDIKPVSKYIPHVRAVFSRKFHLLNSSCDFT